MNKVKYVLSALSLDEYTHVVVQERSKISRQPCALGGGRVSSVVSRFGDRLVESAYITDGILRIIVEEEKQ